jgi:hypothetical protein
MIKSKPANQKYRDGWDAIFGKKQPAPTPTPKKKQKDKDV